MWGGGRRNAPPHFLSVAVDANVIGLEEIGSNALAMDLRAVPLTENVRGPHRVP